MIKNKTLKTLLLAVLLFSAKAALAECDGFYIAGRVGSAKLELEDDRSVSNIGNYIIDKRRFLASGALGYRYKHVRGELEYVWRKKNNKEVVPHVDGSFKSSSYMFVVYYDFFPYSWFTPFVNAGIGYSRNNLSYFNEVVKTGYGKKENAFTWSLGAGISAKITNRWNLDIGYRYYDMGDFDIYNGSASLTDQEIYMGLRYVL